MKAPVALVLTGMLLGTALLAIAAQSSSDPLARYRAPDGSLHIPGGALTPELQRLLFGRNDLQPYLNLTYYAPTRSAYRTAELVPSGYLAPNPNVFSHPRQEQETLVGGLARMVASWFPPMDWGAQLRAAASWLLGLFTWDARATVTVSGTTVTDISAAANTCTTSQTTGASDNGVLVMLSERGVFTFASVTYGSVSLALIANTAANGGGVVRTEIWGFAGVLPAGAQTMTATLSGGQLARMTCATVLLQGVKATGSFINGTSNSGATANATVTLGAAVTTGNLGFAVAALQQSGGGGVQPTAVTGTGATATDLYGVAVGHCSGGSGASNECAAGADIPNPGTAITWTNVATTWVVSAVEAVATPTCGTVGGADCYRIGVGGTWSSPANWSNSAGGASCGCTPTATDFAIFNASPTGTTSLAAATTIAGIDMTGFTGTLDTTANNWALTVNGDFTIQGTFLPRGSAIAASGNVSVVGASTVVTMSTSTWTVNGTWTNNSTSGAWSAGTGTVTIRDASSGTLIFGNLGVNEFNNLTLDASAVAGLTYTMAANGLRVANTLLVQNSTGGATGPTILDTSASNLAVTAGALTVSTRGALNTRASTVTVNGNVNVSAANGYVANTGGSWVVTGTWNDASTSASWSFAAAMTFRAPANRAMTFGAQAGNEFSGTVTFDTTAAAGMTYTMGTNALDVGGLLTVQNTAGGASGAVVLDTSVANLAANTGGVALPTRGALNTRASTVTVNGNVNVSAGNAYVTNTGGSWTVTGSWTNRTTSASWSFIAAISFRAAAPQSMIFTGSNIAGNEFGGAAIFDTTAAGGVTYTMAAGATGDSSLKVAGALTIRNTAGGATAATLLDTSAGNYGITAASLTLGNPRGALGSRGSAITINGAVNVSDANSYLVLGTAAWTVTGTWTNSSTDAADWSAGTGTTTFRSAANATMTFANLGTSELNNVILDTSAAAGVTYTMATNGLRISGTLTIQNTAGAPTGNVVLTTSGANLAVTAGGVALGVRGTLTANGSTITVNGSWTSTAANHVWNKGTSTVVFGATGTLTMSAGESFNVLTQSAGTTTLGSNVTATGATTVNGTLDTSASSFTLTLQSTLAIGASGVLNLEASIATTTGNVTIASGGAVRFTGAGTWTINGSWTDNNAGVPASWAVATSTVRIVDPAAATLTFWTAAGSEFNNLVLDSSAAAGLTYTQTNTLQAAGTLTVQNTAGGATGSVVLDATASNYGAALGGLALGALGAYASRNASVTVGGAVSVAANGYITSTAAGSWAVGGSWTNNTTSGSWSFAAPITFQSAASRTMTFKATATEFGGAVTFDTTVAGGVTYSMATNGLTLAGLLTIRNSTAVPTTNTILDTSASGLGITAGSVTLGTNGTLRANGSTISVGGNWTALAANATFTAGTSTVVFTAAASINTTQAFYNLTVSAGTSTLAANASVNASLTVSGGTLAKGTFTLSTATLTLSGGGLTSTSGSGSVSGNVTISSPASYIAFGSETWTIGGTWTNASTSASWSAGTGTVVFNDGSSATMTFAGTNLAVNEFNNVTFDTTAAGGVAFTMSTRGLRLGGTLTVRNSSGGATGPAVLSTSAASLPVTAGAVVVGTFGTLSANASPITLAGNWTATAANATFTAGTSTVSFGANATVAMTQPFYNLMVTAGAVAAGTDLTVGNALTVSGGSLALAAFALSTGSLTLSGGALTATSGPVGVAGNVNVSAAASYIAFGSGAWTVSGSWTNASTSGSWNAGSATVMFNAATAQTMTFAGSNLPGNEFAGVTFNSGAATVTFTMATRGLRVGGTLTVGGGAGTTTLDTSGSSLPVNATTLNVAGGGALTANGSTITVASIDTRLGTFAAGSSTVVVNASGGSVNIPQTANNLTVNPGINTTFSGAFTWTGVLTLTNASVGFGAGSLSASGAATMSFASATITMGAGDWDTSSATTFTATGSTVTFSGNGSLSLGAGASFATLTITGGTRTLLTQLTANGLLTVSGGVLEKGTHALTINGGLTLSGGALASVSGAVNVTGNVTIPSPVSYIRFGSETWTVGGSWTNNSTSGSWAVGTATVTFASTSSQTMTFAGLPGNAAEFYDVAFDGGASTVSYTMAANALVWSGTLTVQGGTGTTTLATSDLGLLGGSLAVGNGGVLASNASTVSVSTVMMIGGVSGTVTATTGLWTVSGSWDTSGAGSTWSAGTSLVTFTGISATIGLAAGQSFYSLTIVGTVSLSSSVTATAALTVDDGATLTMTGQSIAFNGLTEVGTGRIVDGTVTVVNFTVTNSDIANLTTIGDFVLWSLGAEYTWTHASTIGTSTLTFTIGGNTSGDRYNVTKDGSAFSTGLVDGLGRIQFTMLGSDPLVDVILAAPCGSTRYWVGGTGTWSATAHWSSTSGGVGGCPVPGGTTSAVFDANSGSGTATLDQNASVASLNTTGWTGTIALGGFNLAVSGNVTHASGTISIGASTANGLAIAGNLTLSGSAVLDGSGAASLVSVTGNMSIASPTAYVRMGSGTWTFSGSWSNASTSTSWAPGTGTVVFDSTTSQTMTFAGLASDEFHNVSFGSLAGTGAVTFTMGANPLRWGNALTIQDASGSTTTLATANLPLYGGSLVVGDAGILTANASTVSLVDVTMTGGTSGTITLTSGAWTVGGNWDTSGAGSVFSKGASTVTMSGAGRSVRILDASHGFYNLTISGTITQASGVDVSGALSITGALTTAGNAITGGADLVVSSGGILSASTSSLVIASVTMNDTAANVISLTSGSLGVSGSWDTSGPASQLLAGTSTVTLSGASATITLGATQAFANLVITGGIAQASQMTASSLTIASGILAKGAFPLTVTGDLTLSGGSLTSVSGSATVSGNVEISSVASYIVFGSEAWTISGSWTNASTSASWSAGAGSVTFNSNSPRTMTFAGANLPGVEFNAIVFNSGIASATFGMAGSGLRAHAITIRGGPGTTTLNTSGSNLGLTADALIVAAGGALVANASTIVVQSMDTDAGSFAPGTSLIVVNASGGSLRIPQAIHSLTVDAGISTTFASSLAWSAALTLAGATAAFAGNVASLGSATMSIDSAILTVAGSWDTSSAAALTAAGSTVTLTGSGQFVTMGGAQQFATLVLMGSVALGSDLKAATLNVAPSAILTKTNYGITFNVLAVYGTVADGSVTVSGFTVSNSDSTALVTISVFTAWSVGSSYAWTHTSNETSQTITWTIGGNTAGFLYHVIKDGSTFSDGIVDQMGQVVFTMLGSDPSMQVTVAAPPPPPWWQAPYVLAMPPAALLVVIAMFAQRQRWKPTKAFLVDERGQLLREFTLDPKCRVSYAEAKQAGALDAVDKDVRVSKYHARAVHGDMLSLIMLAIGPADVRELDFARGMLASIQDKFEDRVSQRVQEARAAEADLQVVRERVEGEQVDLKARARVFGDMVNAFTVARGKLDGEARGLQAQSEDLESRERRVEENRKNLDEEARELETLRASLDKGSRELESVRHEVAATSRDLEARESHLEPKEQELAARQSAITSREAEQAERQSTLDAAEAKLTADLEAYHANVQKARELEEELAEERKSLDDLSLQMDQREQALQTRLADVETREKAAADRSQQLRTDQEAVESREQSLGQREADLSARESSIEGRATALADQEAKSRDRAVELQTLEVTLANRARSLADERKALDDRIQHASEERKALESRASDLEGREADVARRTKDLADLKENLGPREAALVGKEDDLRTREKALADERAAFQDQQELVERKALEIQQQMEVIKDREATLAQEKIILQDAKAAFDSEHKELEGEVAAFGLEMDRRKAELASQERTLGEARMQLTRDREDFDAQRAEKSQWIASKEIELEAKEQTLADRELEIRAQAEESSKHHSELVSREETLEIESDKLDRARAELEGRRAELTAMARDLDGKIARFRDEESRKGEELRTWQSTLESEQALLKEQRETFETEMQDLRESWAGRMIRVEQKEEELKERETKVQSDIDWVARNEADIGKREKAAAETLRTANELKAEGERLRAELEQRALEVDSRDRGLREEAATQSIELEKRTEALQVLEAELAGRKAQSERELANQVQKLKDREAELLGRQQALDGREADLASREAVLTSHQEALRKDEDRLARDRGDLQATEKQLESRQLEFAQTRERLDAESTRSRTEMDAVRQSLAAKEADLLSERERLERESASLQEKLGTKAKEMAAREKGVAAREDELRSEEQDLEARTREIESRERQAGAHLAEIAAREKALAQAELEQKAHQASFDESVQKFEVEAASRKKEWQDLQATLKSQEAQLAASAETRQAEIRQRMDDLEQKEHSLNAVMTQAQIERTRLEAQAKGHAAKAADLDEAAARADKRSGELKGMEDELLKARQAFESEKAGWSARRSEELKQLEATRDAAAEQTQQAERLIEEAQRRVYVAAEAEKAAKRQGEELAAALSDLERRRADAEKAEKDLQIQMAQLREASQKLATTEMDLGSRTKQLDALQARLADAERKNLESADELKGRKATLDQEADRLAAQTALLDKREAEAASRHAAVEAKLVDVTTRERVLTTELQRADNLMDDLNRKGAEIAARERGFVSKEESLAKREQELAQRDAEVMEGMRTLERLRSEHESRVSRDEENHRIAERTRKEAEALRTEAEKLKTQAEAMQAEVSKNMRFLQKKALDVLDREEKIRTRETKADEESHLLETRTQILEQKERALEAEKEELTARLEKAKQETEKLRTKIADLEKSGKATADMDEWKRDIENRVKIIQKKALDLLDREEKLRKREEELKAFAQQLGVTTKS